MSGVNRNASSSYFDSYCRSQINDSTRAIADNSRKDIQLSNLNMTISENEKKKRKDIDDGLEQFLQQLQQQEQAETNNRNALIQQRKAEQAAAAAASASAQSTTSIAPPSITTTTAPTTRPAAVTVPASTNVPATSIAARPQAGTTTRAAGGGGAVVRINPDEDQLIRSALERRDKYERRIPLKTELMQRPYANKIRNALLNITAMTTTVKDLAVKSNKMCDFVQSFGRTLPQEVEALLHVFADVIIQRVAEIPVENLLHGKTDFVIAYLVIILCIRYDLFLEIIQSALEYYCPHVTPGLYDAVREKFLTDHESTPIRRSIQKQQSVIAFYAAILQASTQYIAGINLVPANQRHPFNLLYDSASTSPSAISIAWRFMARTINLPKNRFTLFLLQSFLAVGAHEMARSFGQQYLKLASILGSRQMIDECKAQMKFPDDQDRFNAAERYMQKLQQEPQPRPPVDDEGEDLRILPEEPIMNNAINENQ